MVRVLHVVTYMGRGGLETMLMNYYRQMDKDQVQFDFLVHRQEEAAYDSEILESGGKIYRFERLVPWSSSYKKKFVSFLQEHLEYQIIHVHQDCLSSVALSCAKKAGIPVRIAHCHNSSQDKNWKYPIKLFYKRKIADNATRLMACSHEAGEWMFGKGHTLQILPNAVDLSSFGFNETIRNCVRKELGLENQFVLGHVGRFNSVKNQRFLLEVFTEYRKKNPESFLILVGDGPEREAMEKKCEGLHLKDAVLFAGQRTDVNRLLMAMDVFCFPSLYEGFPVSLVEAQTSGLPCLISDRITHDCVICKDLVQFASIDHGPDPWIVGLEQIKEQNGKQKRKARTEEVQQAGYDIETEARKLQEFYLKAGGDQK